MASFKFQKTVLVVSALTGMLFNTQAFAVNTEKGSIDITSKVITATCVLNLDSSASTAGTAAKKTIDFGSFSVANVSSINGAVIVGKGVIVALTLKDPGTTTSCTSIGVGGKWDVAIDMPATAYSTTNIAGNVSLNNTTLGSGAATGLAARMRKSTNTGTETEVLLNNKVPGYGYLLSGNTTGPNLNNTDTINLYIDFHRLSDGTFTDENGPTQSCDLKNSSTDPNTSKSSIALAFDSSFNNPICLNAYPASTNNTLSFNPVVVGAVATSQTKNIWAALRAGAGDTGLVTSKLTVTLDYR